MASLIHFSFQLSASCHGQLGVDQHHLCAMYCLDLFLQFLFPIFRSLTFVKKIDYPLTAFKNGDGSISRGQKIFHRASALPRTIDVWHSDFSRFQAIRTTSFSIFGGFWDCFAALLFILFKQTPCRISMLTDTLVHFHMSTCFIASRLVAPC